MQIRSSRLIYSVIILIALTLTAGIGSADEVNVELVGHFGGSAYDVAVVGNYAYLGQGQDLVVLDMTDVSNPSEVGRVITPSLVTGIAVSGNYAYVASHENGLMIVNITDPSSPTLVGSYGTGTAEDVAVSGNYAYVADGESGLIIIDVNNPATSTPAGSYDTAGYAKGVAVSGNYAYIADDDSGFVILDITNPAVPTLTGSYDTAGNAENVAVSGNYAYVADGSSGLMIVDITNPSSPTPAGSYGINGEASDVAISGNYAYVTDHGYWNGLVIVDITDPSSPTLSDIYYTYSSTHGVAVSGIYAYIAYNNFEGDSGLMIVDISDPSSASFAGSYDIRGEALRVAVSGNYVYVATGRSDHILVSILNVTYPSAPTLAGSYYLFADNGIGITVSGNYAYIGQGFPGLAILDISDPSAPTLVGSYGEYGPLNYTTFVAVSGSYAYVPQGSGLSILDISDPSSPTLVGSSNISGHVAVSGNYAYIASRGLSIVDISDPSTPTLVGTFDTIDPAYIVSSWVAVEGNYAYVTNIHLTDDYDYYGHLEIIDISDPSSPRLTGTFEIDDWVSYVAVAGNYAYLASWDNGLAIVDISDPSAPTLAGSYDTDGHAIDVAVSGNYVYVADDYNGLVILRVDVGPTTVSYTPDYDNRLRQSSPNTVLSISNYIDIGRLGTTSYRDVIWFDFSGYNTTDTISKATLSLYWHYPAGATRTSDTVVEIYRPVEWSPQYVTWNSRMSDIPWATAGGNWFDKNNVAQGTTPYASVTFPAGTVPDNKYYEFDVTQLVQEYVSGTTNTGFFLKAKTEGNNYIAFYSSDWPNADQRPKLTITTTSVPVDNPPVAEAGPNQVATIGAAVTFNGSDSTDDKGITTYSWDFDDRDGITTDATGVTATTTYATPGNYTVTLTVTDTVGQTDSDTLHVVVSGPTTTLTFTPSYDNRLRQSSPNTVLSSSKYLDIGGLGTSGYRDIMSFHQLDGIHTVTKATLSLYWYYPPGATHTSDTVVEIYRPAGWDQKYVTWNSRITGIPWNTPGGDWFDKNGVTQGNTPYASVTFPAGKVPDNKYYEFDVTQLVQEYISGTHGNTGFFLKARTEGGNYIAFYSSEWPNADQRPKLTVTVTSFPGDNPPVAEAGPDQVTTIGSVVTFNGSASTDDIGIASYSWDFDVLSDGTQSEATTVTANHTYTKAGTYLVSLTVTDTGGQTSTDTLKVVVSDPKTTYDNRLRQSSPNTVLSSSNYIDIGRLGTTSYRDVIWFDLNGYNTTDTISKATLSLYWYYPPGATRTSDTVVEVYRPLEWSPQYVTWNSRMSGTPWTTAGGNWFDKNGVSQGTTPYASVTFPAGTVPDNKYYEFDVTQLVQEYVSGTANTGFFLKAKTEGNNYIAFYSSDWPNADQRPKLIVTKA